MKRYAKILMLTAFVLSSGTIFAKNINSNTTQTGNETINESVTINSNKTYTINGDLTIIGSLTTTSSNSSVTVNGNLHITNNLVIGRNTTITVKGLITVDGNITNNGSVTVLSESVFHSKGSLTVTEYGSISFHENSTSIIEGNLIQDGDTPWGLGLIFPNTGDIDANHATLVVGGDYKIYSTSIGLTDGSANYIDPANNPEFYVFGKNDLEKVGIRTKPATKENFDASHSGGLDGYVNIVLPIELVYFDAIKNDNSLIFNWQTASEYNNDYFTIERSDNANDFEEVATIAGAGTTTSLNDYQYTYRTPHAGTVYFRLKQTDYDGQYTYSEMISVVFGPKYTTNSTNFTVYPNPATDYIAISGGEYETVTFVSANGSVLRTESAKSTHCINSLPKGINFVIIHTANGDINQRFIKR